MTTLTIEKKMLQILFDTAVGSMDFSSGFLDDEEVEALRAVAVLLEVDPMLATPGEFKCKYSGTCEPWPDGIRVFENRCRWCKKILEPKETP